MLSRVKERKIHEDRKLIFQHSIIHKCVPCFFAFCNLRLKIVLTTLMHHMHDFISQRIFWVLTSLTFFSNHYFLFEDREFISSASESYDLSVFRAQELIRDAERCTDDHGNIRTREYYYQQFKVHQTDATKNVADLKISEIYFFFLSINVSKRDTMHSGKKIVLIVSLILKSKNEENWQNLENLENSFINAI